MPISLESQDRRRHIDIDLGATPLSSECNEDNIQGTPNKNQFTQRGIHKPLVETKKIKETISYSNAIYEITQHDHDDSNPSSNKFGVPSIVPKPRQKFSIVPKPRQRQAKPFHDSHSHRKRSDTWGG